MHFHLAAPGLRPGHVILPGNWGSVIANTPGHRWGPMEERFEYARLQLAPGRPSRLNATYAFEDERAVDVFHARRPQDAVYCVEAPEEGTVLTHRGNILLIHPALGYVPDFAGWAANAKEYWLPTIEHPTEQSDYIAELLFGGPLTVRKLLREPLA